MMSIHEWLDVILPHLSKSKKAGEISPREGFYVPIVDETKSLPENQLEKFLMQAERDGLVGYENPIFTWKGNPSPQKRYLAGITEKGEDHIASRIVDYIIDKLRDYALSNYPTHEIPGLIDLSLSNAEAPSYSGYENQVFIRAADLDQAERVFRILSDRSGKEHIFDPSIYISPEQPLITASIPRAYPPQ